MNNGYLISIKNISTVPIVENIRYFLSQLGQYLMKNTLSQPNERRTFQRLIRNSGSAENQRNLPFTHEPAVAEAGSSC